MSWYPPRPKRRPGSGPWRAAGKRPFGATWWGKAWVEALEQRARLDTNRLPRGRTYARTGAVGDLEVRPGQIIAAVQGSRATPYKVTVRVRAYSEAEWERTLVALASQVGHLAALLDGELPPGVADDLAAAGLDLLPVAGEVQPRCSCPDWADPCKHSAAVCYLVADTLDADPFQLFLLRGRDRASLLAGLRARRAEAIGGGGWAADGGAGSGRLDVDATRSWGSDPGLNAKHAWERWATRQAAEHERIQQGEASVQPRHHPLAIPAVPLPPPRPGRPTVLAVDPPAGSGVTATALETLAADAVQRAWELAHGERSTGLELDAGADIARRAANMLDVGGGDPHNRGDIYNGGDFSALARGIGVPARELLRQALAWNDGGPEGLALLLADWDPPPGAVAGGRALLGSGATVRRSRVTLGDRQLRLGRDGRWYPYRRAGRRGATWDPDGGPLEQPDDRSAGAGDDA
jgi:uncharacterized Zn finger protein